MRSVNIDIAVTHFVTRKRQTLVAALGVTLGVGIYLFMNSLSSGFSLFSRGEIFKNSAHISIYKEDEISSPLNKTNSTDNTTVIINPQVVNTSHKIINPEDLLSRIKRQPYVTHAITQVSFDVYYTKGKVQIHGTAQGVNIVDYNAMFNTGKYLVAGRLTDLPGNLNGIIIGSGIAEKFNLGLNDNLTVTSSYNVVKVMKVVGIYTSGNSATDNARSFVNISTAQQFVKEGPSFVTHIFVNTPDAGKSEKFTPQLRQITDYTVEDWKETNADLLAGDKTRSTLMGAISFSILIVAAFGIYNILSSTIIQKINDIAILKATGFTGKDVIRIFLIEAVLMGAIGTLIGLIFGGILIGIMSNIYMGGPVGYFPIHFETRLFVQSFLLGIVITFCAGYFPSLRAARIDPVEIFRK